MEIKTLYEEKRNLYAQAQDLKALARDENRELNEEEFGRWEKFLADMEAIDRKIENLEKEARMSAKMGDIVFDTNGKQTERGDAEKRYSDAFSKYMRTGVSSLTDEERHTLNMVESPWGMGVAIDPTGEMRTKWRSDNWEKRATNSLITNPTYFNPTTVSDMFGQTLKAIGPWMDACTVINTPTGENLELPYYNDAGNDGALEAAGTDAVASSTDLDAAKVTLSNYWISSTGIKVNWASLRDANYPVNTFVVDPLLKRLARVISTYATTGTGSSQPKGIAICAVTGELALKATAPTQTDLQHLLRLVDYAYHGSPSSGWMMHSDTMFRIGATVKSTTYNNDPLWQPSFAQGIPQTLLGYKYWVNNSMNTITAAPGNSVLFGDFSYFMIRYVGPLIITRLEERYAELGQVAFLASQFMDSNVRIVGTTYAPIKKIKNIMT